MKLTDLALLTLGASLAMAADVPGKNEQITAALLAAPADLRDGAAVVGFDASGKRVVLREGRNELLCLADNPAKAGFEVDCYHKDLEPFMARGRELLEQNITGAERNKIRFKEIEEGKLPMPRAPRALYVLTGKSYDAATGKVEGQYLRWVLYWPFATAESIGLSTKASESAPWLMSPGTAGAHIMISPPKPKP